jgi:drug/metabolite transporter (DMT)-like permease
VSAIAGGVAFLSALSFAGSTSLQHMAAERAPLSASGPRLVRHLVKRPLWLLGQALSATGLMLHATALHLGSIALVQPIVISGVVLAVPVRSALNRRWPWPRELLAVAITAVGLTAFLLASDPSTPTTGPLEAPAMVICVLGAIVAAAAGIIARLVRDPADSAFWLGFASGALFGVVAGLIKGVLYVQTHGGWVAVLSSWMTWTLVGLGTIAMINNQHAYRRARLSASMPVLNVVDGVVALIFGFVAFHEVPRHTPFFVTIEVLAFATIAAGLFVVAGLEDKPTSIRHPASVGAGGGGHGAGRNGGPGISPPGDTGAHRHA